MAEIRTRPRKFTCCICGKGPQDGVSVHRINAKGVAGIWACLAHIGQTDGKPAHPEIVEIVKELGSK